MSALSTLRLIAPEFSKLEDKEVRQYINLYRPMVSRARFGESYELAMAYYVAHKLKILGLGAGADEEKKNIALNMGVASYGEGDTNITYSTPAAVANMTADAELSLTVYGIQFLQLRNTVIMSATIDWSGVNATSR